MRARDTSLLAAITAFAPLALLGTAGAAEPYGTWVRPSTGTQVNFYDCGGKLCGKIAGVKDPSRQSEIGKMMLPGAAKTGDNKWEGDLTDVSADKTYSGVVTFSGGGLNLKGCFLMVCKGETWRKIK